MLNFAGVICSQGSSEQNALPFEALPNGSTKRHFHDWLWSQRGGIVGVGVKP
jgi:hypothetical protein